MVGSEGGERSGVGRRVGWDSDGGWARVGGLPGSSDWVRSGEGWVIRLLWSLGRVHAWMGEQVDRERRGQ